MANVIVMTGGWDTEAYMTQYYLADFTESPLTPLGKPGREHACGVYQDLDGQHVCKKLYSYLLSAVEADIKQFDFKTVNSLFVLRRFCLLLTGTVDDFNKLQ